MSSAATANSTPRFFDDAYVAQYERNAIQAVKAGNAHDIIICDYNYSMFPYWSRNRIYMEFKSPIHGYDTFDNMAKTLYKISQAHAMVAKINAIDGIETTVDTFIEGGSSELILYNYILTDLQDMNEIQHDIFIMEGVHSGNPRDNSKIIRYFSSFRNIINKYADQNVQLEDGYNRPLKRDKAINNAVGHAKVLIDDIKNRINQMMAKLLKCSESEIPFLIHYKLGTGKPTHE